MILVVNTEKHMKNFLFAWSLHFTKIHLKSHQSIHPLRFALHLFKMKINNYKFVDERTKAWHMRMKFSHSLRDLSNNNKNKFYLIWDLIVGVLLFHSWLPINLLTIVYKSRKFR